MGIESAEKVDQTSWLSDWLILLQINILTIAKLKMDMYVWEKQKIRNSTLMLLSLLLAMWRETGLLKQKSLQISMLCAEKVVQTSWLSDRLILLQINIPNMLQAQNQHLEWLQSSNWDVCVGFRV
jgi:hypothetical protein